MTYERRRRERVVALDGVSLEAGDAELVAVVGESGSGKSTLLRAVAGLARLDGGSVAIAGRDVTALPPGPRQVALVPQNLPLYPHLDVTANITFGEVARRTPRSERTAKVRRAVELLDLAHLLDRRPDSLSGGERQRVALARALVREPAAFLLDEPLSGLSGATRLALRAAVKRVQRETATTMLYVTHDPQEAMAIGDRVAVLVAGRIEQYGAPVELFARPATVAVARLVGPLPMNLLAGALAGRGVPTVGVRPERVRIVALGIGRLVAVVTGVELIGEQTLVRLSVVGAGGDVELLAVAAGTVSVGTEVGADWEPSDEHLFDVAGRRITATDPAVP